MVGETLPDVALTCDVDDKPKGWGQPEADACSMKSEGWPTFYVTWGEARMFRACFAALGRESIVGEADTIAEAIAEAVAKGTRGARFGPGVHERGAAEGVGGLRRAFGLSESEAQIICAEPDHRSAFSAVRDGTVTVVEKKLDDGRRFLAGILAGGDLDTPRMNWILQVPDRIRGRETPIETLSDLLEVYGLRFGPTDTKLLIEEEFEFEEGVTEASVAQRFAPTSAPNGHETFVHIPFEMLGNYQVLVPLGFAVDLTSLREDL